MFLSARAETNILKCKERKMKKFIALFMAVMFCFIAASCTMSGNNKTTTTAPGVTTTTAGTTTTGSDVTTTKPSETTTSTTTEEEPPIIEPQKEILDIETVMVGNFVRLQYNKATCTVETEVKKGVGSKQSVTIKVTMRDGFIYDGISVDNALVNKNGKRVTTSKTYTLENVSSETKVYVNTSMTVVYHTGEGKTSNGSDTKTVTFSLVGYHNPRTLEENGYFKRDGYTLLEYNTKEDGTGTPVSLGSRVDAEGKPSLDLWCVWQKNTDESSFKTETAMGGVRIKEYTGNDEIVCIPEKIGGNKVIGIAANAFSGATMKEVIIAKTVKAIEEGAFTNCKNLETVVVFDGEFGAGGIGESCFVNCDSFKHFYVNATYTLYESWALYGAGHLDRLMWAKDMKKIIIVGGSGSYFGYDSEIIDKALNGEYVIINFGENANVSALLYFDLIEDFVGEDDILLWSPESGYYTLGSYSFGPRGWYFRQSDYGFLRYIDRSQFTDLISRFPAQCVEMKNAEKRNILPYDAFNNSASKYGDGLDTANRVNQGRDNSYNLGWSISAKEEMAALAKRMKEKGCNIFFTYAAMQDGGEGISDDVIKEYTERLTSVIDMTVISDYKNCLYPKEYFSDSEWHLVWKGAQERSRHVAEDLKKQLGK